MVLDILKYNIYLRRHLVVTFRCACVYACFLALSMAQRMVEIKPIISISESEPEDLSVEQRHVDGNADGKNVIKENVKCNAQGN